MKLSNRNYENCIALTPTELREAQRTTGWAVYLIGRVVYWVLRAAGQNPKSFYGICPYFEIGKSWGGFALGWFFVCCKQSNDRLKSHEVGHGVQNASIGGITMLLLSLCSVVRYWWINIFEPKISYDSWWFEGQATEIGTEYVAKHKEI